jgi:hypothetical protein
LGGILKHDKLKNLDKRLGPANTYASHCQLYKSSFSDNGVLPTCVKGFSVGMSDPDFLPENLEALLYPNSDKNEIVSKYIDYDLLSAKRS